MPNSEKISAVAEIAEHFTNSSAAVITEYRGLSVKQLTDLRRALGRGTTYAVVKNTLTKRAAADAGVSIPDSLLIGPTAIAFVTGDPVEAAKGLRDFAKINPLLVIKGGVLDGKALSPAEINTIADLEPREVLLAKLAGAMKALPTRAASLFQAPLSKMARLAKALEEKKPAAAVPPAELGEPAAVATAEPVEAAVETVEVPVETLEVAAETVEATAETLEASAEMAEASVELIDVAVETVDAPVETVETAEAPVEPVEAPVETAEAPVETAEAPSAAPEAPAEPAE